MRKFILLTTFALAGYLSFAQSVINTDSLKKVLQGEKRDSANTLHWLQKIETLYSTETAPLLLICDWGLDNAKQLNNKYLQAYAYMAKGFSYLYTDKADEASSLNFTDALKISEANNYYDITAQTYNGLSHYYGLARQDAKEDEFTLKSIEASRKANMLQGVAYGYTALAANIYGRNKNNNDSVAKAVHYQRLSLDAAESLKDSAALILFYLNIVSYYTKLEKFDSATYFLTKSKTIIDAKKADNDNMTYYYRQANLNYKKKEYREAVKNYDTAISYARKYDSYSFEVKVNHSLVKLYSETGDFKNAFRALMLVKNYEDSALTKENFARAADIQNKYEREKKDNEILKLNNDKEIAAIKRSRLTILLIAAAVAISLLGVLVFLLLKNIRSRKKAYAELERKNEEIKEQAIQLSRQARLIAKFQSQMNPHFTFNALHNIYGLVATNDNEKAVQQIQALAGLMRQTLTNSVKEEISLKEEIKYLQSYIEFEKAAAPVPFEFSIEVGKGLEDAVIPPMMIQPFIENAVKHADFDRTTNPFVKVLIEKEQDLMKLVIQDNGKGIDSQAGNLSRLSHSISIIRSRIELLFQNTNKTNAAERFRIISVPVLDKGTSVEFYLPLNFEYDS